MVVVIDSFQDSETFDMKAQKIITRTGFWLKELNGAKIYKPCILNNTNADFCEREFKSPFMEHWIGKPFVLYAQADKRHGQVARFKKYYPPVTITDTNALGILATSTTLPELQANWKKLTAQEQALPTVLAKKDELKSTLK